MGIISTHFRPSPVGTSASAERPTQCTTEMIERKQNEMADVPDISQERGTPSIPWMGILDLHSVDQLVQCVNRHHLLSSSSIFMRSVETRTFSSYPSSITSARISDGYAQRRLVQTPPGLPVFLKRAGQTL